MSRETIREFNGRIIGYIETDFRGDKKVTNFSGKILGYYRKSNNATVDFSGKILYFGDASALLLK